MTEVSDPRSVPFVVTKEHRRFAEFCDACRRNCYIGLCYGAPGVGKTVSARHYAAWDLIEPDLKRQAALPPWDRPAPPRIAVSTRAVFYTPSVTNSPKMVETELGALRSGVSDVIERAVHGTRRVEDYLRAHASRDRTEVILIDEADRLRVPSLEQVRDIYDRGAFGVVLIGMPGLEKRMARYAQLYSRVGFVHQFRALSGEELRFLLEQKWEQIGIGFDAADFTTAEAMAAIIRITGGNFRLLQRLFLQIRRVLEINHLQTITKEVVEAARESLVIGTL